MILPADRAIAITLIRETVTAGAGEKKACWIMDISQRTLFRWKKRPEDQRPHAKHPEPQNKLSLEEKQVILEHMNSDRFKSQPPSQMVPQLADEGIYLASESTIYRILKEVKQQNHRGLYIPTGKLHLHGHLDPASRRMRSTLTEADPIELTANSQNHRDHEPGERSVRTTHRFPWDPDYYITTEYRPDKPDYPNNSWPDRTGYHFSDIHRKDIPDVCSAHIWF